jgi:hypothetical protein
VTVPVRCKCDRIVNDEEYAWRDHLELNDRHAAGGNDRRLGVVRRHCEIALRPHRVENLADSMERRDEIRPGVADETAYGLANFGGQRPFPDRRADRAVEHDILWLLIDSFRHAERLQALLSIDAPRLEVALHQAIFMVNPRQAFLRFDEDHAVHAVGDMHRDWRRRAVKDIEAGIEARAP